MDKQSLIYLANTYVEESEDNRINSEIAISEKVIGMKIFEQPIFAFAAANDELFLRLKEKEAIGEHFMLPKEWLPEAKTVISFFLPFTDVVKKGNKNEPFWPSEEWLHARVEGQAFLNKLLKYLKSELVNTGFASVVPTMDERFWAKTKPKSKPLSFTSNWSERHIAFVCGLGTFGLSKGLITKKGVAGRFGSIVTTLETNPDQRYYEGVYDNCNMCGACVKKCPVKAISLETGKNHDICCDFLDETMDKFKPRYGCGKCQVGVPCESKIPVKRG